MAGWVEKRGKNKWRLNVPGGVDQNGKRVIHRKVVEATSKREAEKLLDVFSAEVQKGRYIEPSKYTFKVFVEKWIRDYGETNLEPKTLFRYKEILYSRVIPAMGHLRLDQIKPFHLIEFYKNLQEDGIRKDGKPGGLNPKTILQHHRVISSILSDAVQWGIINENPASRVKPPKVKKKEIACYDKEQTAALLAALDEEPLKYKIMVMMAVATGLRRGELMGLEWRDVDFKNNSIEIRQTSQYVPGKGVFPKEPKTEESKRLIAVPTAVMRLLKEYKKQQAQERLLAGDLWEGSTRLFTTWDGKPMHPDTISKWFPKFLERCNLPHIRFHDLRHLNATLLIAEGVPLKNVSKRLGHSNISTTADIYAHALRSVDQEAAEKLNKLFKKQVKS